MHAFLAFFLTTPHAHPKMHKTGRWITKRLNDRKKTEPPSHRIELKPLSKFSGSSVWCADHLVFSNEAGNINQFDYHWLLKIVSWKEAI